MGEEFKALCNQGCPIVRLAISKICLHLLPVSLGKVGPTVRTKCSCLS